MLVLVIAALIQFITSFIGSMIQVAIPLMSSDLNLTIELANWISISYYSAEGKECQAKNGAQPSPLHLEAAGKSILSFSLAKERMGNVRNESS